MHYPDGHEWAQGEGAVHDPGEAVGPPLLDLTDVKVDIDALDDCLMVLQAELNENLQPYSGQIISNHRQGEALGQSSASVPLAQLRHEYFIVQQAAINGLVSYVDATRVLIRALELMTEHYRGADGLAQARVADVLGAINAAQAEADAHKAAIAAAETHREQHRMTFS